MVGDVLNQKRRTVFKIDGIAFGVRDRGDFSLFFVSRDNLPNNRQHGFVFLGSKHIKGIDVVGFVAVGVGDNESVPVVTVCFKDKSLFAVFVWKKPFVCKTFP